MKHLVFVYGTLKAGFGNHGVLATSEAEFIGEDETTPEYVMFSLGGFPGVSRGGSTAIKGELWTVENLEGLDALEGHPTFYERQEVPLAGGETAWMYILPEDYKDGRETIINGEWEGRKYG